MTVPPGLSPLPSFVCLPFVCQNPQTGRQTGEFNLQPLTRNWGTDIRNQARRNQVSDGQPEPWGTPPPSFILHSFVKKPAPVAKPRDLTSEWSTSE